MEVHAHTHTPRKKWTHYFWEFIMLFLAVFCGFLAEYQLEHKIEKERGKQYILTLVEDIESDLRQIDSLKKTEEWNMHLTDSLQSELIKPTLTKNSNKAYELWIQSQWNPLFLYNDRTIEQLKNAGGLRLIKKTVADKIMEYYKLVKSIKDLEANLNLLYSESINNRNNLFSVIDLNNNVSAVPLLSSDKKHISAAYSSTIDHKNFLQYLIWEGDKLRGKGQDLLFVIRKEYHLK